jgi:RimJ/RimL family protein N-acetyltransferase
VLDWTPARVPQRQRLRGEHVLLRPVEVDDAAALYEASRDPAIWTYLPYGPYTSVDEMRLRVIEMREPNDPLYYGIVRDGAPQGIASYLRIKPDHGTIEIGHIWFGTPLQRTTAATEAIFVLAHHAFDELGYRRLEWKCNALNAKSRRAAERFGFTFEGVFRNHQVVKGRNRDTAWYAITGEEWPAIRAAFQSWLAPSNFDDRGRQRTALAMPRRTPR